MCKVLAIEGDRREQIRENPAGELSLHVEGVTAAVRQAGICRADEEPSEAQRLYCVVLEGIASGGLKPSGTCGPPACPEASTPTWHYTEAELRRLAAVLSQR